MGSLHNPSCSKLTEEMSGGLRHHNDKETARAMRFGYQLSKNKVTGALCAARKRVSKLKSPKAQLRSLTFMVNKTMVNKA